MHLDDTPGASPLSPAEQMVDNLFWGVVKIGLLIGAVQLAVGGFVVHQTTKRYWNRGLARPLMRKYRRAMRK
jgi:hypothetical protein